MKHTPSEIRTKNFSVKLRGIDLNEVKAFLESVSSDMEELLQQKSELKQSLIELETKLKDYTAMEKAIHQTFMQAQETGGKAVENARKEAQLIISEAELHAAKILEKAQSELTNLNEHLTILKAQKDSIVVRLKMLLKSELDLIKTLEIDSDLQRRNMSDKLNESSEGKTEIEEIIRNLD